jgi:predicted kinase
MRKLILTVGISGSGKSTWSRDYIDTNRNTLRINRDDLRKTLVGDLMGYYQRPDIFHIEECVSELERCAFRELIKEYDVIIDNTNLQKKVIQDWVLLTTENNAEVNFKLFNCELTEAKLRVGARDIPNWNAGQTGYCNTDELPVLKYINNQYNQFKHIKQWISESYPNSII